jgi:aspartate aminotransferase-like enzyme
MLALENINFFGLFTLKKDVDARIVSHGKARRGKLHSIADRMQSIFATKGDVLLMGSSGTGSLEAAVTNMFGPGDTLLACPTGVFGERIAAIAKMWGCTVEMLETAWGAGVDPQALAARLRADREKRITGILLTHNETSTGVQIDLGAMSRAIGDHPAYVVVDSVSGLGASDGVHSVTVTAILTPHGLDNKTVLTKLLHEHGVVISGGQGKMAGKRWRWGTMGDISEADVVAALEAFEIIIPTDGLPGRGRGRGERGARRIRRGWQEEAHGGQLGRWRAAEPTSRNGAEFRPY